MTDPFDEDADIRAHLAVLGPAALAELRRILEAPSTRRTEILRGLTARPAAADLATLIAMADTDEVVRLRLLRRSGTSASSGGSGGIRVATPSTHRADNSRQGFTGPPRLHEQLSRDGVPPRTE